MNEENKEVMLMDLLLRVKVLEKILIDKNLVSEKEFSELMSNILLNISKTIIENTIKK